MEHKDSYHMLTRMKSGWFFFFFFNNVAILFFFLIYLFIFGCVGSSFLCEGFL